MNRITLIIHISSSIIGIVGKIIINFSLLFTRYLTQVLQIGATLAISGVGRIVLNTHLGMGDVYTLKILSVITEKEKERHKRASKDIKGRRKTNKDIKGQVRT